jgi:hypothetical protein
MLTGCHYGALHFITPSVEIKNYCLITKEVPESHTAINLAEALQSATDDWELSDKVYGFATDNIVNAVVDKFSICHVLGILYSYL